MNRKEKILRQEIRRIVRATLNEGDYGKKDKEANENIGRATKTASSRLDRLVDTPYMRALQKSMQVGSAQQKAAATLMIIQKLIGNDAQAVNKLKQRLQMKSIRQSVTAPPQTESIKEQEEGEDLKGALGTRKEKMEKTILVYKPNEVTDYRKKFEIYALQFELSKTLHSLNFNIIFLPR